MYTSRSSREKTNGYSDDMSNASLYIVRILLYLQMHDANLCDSTLPSGETLNTLTFCLNALTCSAFFLAHLILCRLSFRPNHYIANKG